MFASVLWLAGSFPMSAPDGVLGRTMTSWAQLSGPVILLAGLLQHFTTHTPSPDRSWLLSSHCDTLCQCER